MSEKAKIMLVDDDDAVISYLAVRLASIYNVVSTTDPGKALALAKKESPDAILCDIDMPEMGGGEVLKALSGDLGTAHIPFIFLTGLVSAEEARDLQGSISGRPGVAKQAPLRQLVSVINQHIWPAAAEHPAVSVSAGAGRSAL